MIVAVHGGFCFGSLVGANSHVTVIYDNALIGKRTERRWRSSIAKLMVMDRGIYKIIGIISFAKGGGFKKGVSFKGGAVCMAGVWNDDLRLMGNGKHIR